MDDVWDKKYSNIELKELELAINSYIPNLRVIKLIEEYLQDGSYVLEAGCGTGRLITSLAKRNPIISFGVDLSRKSIELSKDLSFRVGVKGSFVRCDLMNLPFKIRVTKIDGLVILTVPTKLRPDGWDLYKFLKKPGYLQLSFTPKKLKQLMGPEIRIEKMFGEGILLTRNFKFLNNIITKQNLGGNSLDARYNYYFKF